MSTSEYATKFNKFLNGELRVDGWMSDWQKDLIRRRNEENAKAAEKVKREKTK